MPVLALLVTQRPCPSLSLSLLIYKMSGSNYRVSHPPGLIGPAAPGTQHSPGVPPRAPVQSQPLG